MNKYELALVINGKADEETKEATLEKVKSYIENAEGTIVNIDNWGKRRLAYEIEKVKEGFYYFITFESKAEVPAEIESRVRIIEQVLRYLIIRVEE
jgi:small subunit ribosomal protein S6